MSSKRDPHFTGPLRAAFLHHDPDDARRRDSLFGLGNGVIFARGCPPEAVRDGAHYAGTYAAGYYGRRLFFHNGTEIGHDSLVNLPNWQPLTFRIGDGEWFCEDWEILDYRHTLDMGNGVTERELRVGDPQGRQFSLSETRLVSMARPHIAAIRWKIKAEIAGTLEIKSGIDGGTLNANTDRHFIPPYRHLHIIRTEASEPAAIIARTRHGDRTIAVATRTGLDCPAQRRAEIAVDSVAACFTTQIETGGQVTLEKLAAIVVDDDGAVARAEAADAPSFAELAAEQAANWAGLWRRVGIRAEQPLLAQAIAYHSFHILQAASPLSANLALSIASRGWQEAYHGQIFWDDVLLAPFLNHRFPETTRSLLLYRFNRLDEARRAAQASGFAGAMFPWRSAATGAEETPAFQFNPRSGRWNADHTYLQRHIGAMIAHHVWHYWMATGDKEFLCDYGLEMLVEIARFWASAAQYDARDDRYDICGVVGPDEYHTRYPNAAEPGLNNNAYTNVMAASALLHAADAVADFLQRASRLGVTDSETASWRNIAARIRLCFLEQNILAQFEGFDRLQPLSGADFSRRHPNGRIDWELEARGDDINAYRASKQADVLTLFYFFNPPQLCRLINFMGYPVNVDCLKRTAEFYLDYVTHESSLSHVVCAGALAMFDIQKSWAFFEQSLFIDWSFEHSASAEEGLHLGAMACSLDILQRHYLGLHLQDEAIYLTPCLPPELGPLSMDLLHRGQQITLAWTGTAIRLSAAPGNAQALEVIHDESRQWLHPGQTLEFYVTRPEPPECPAA